MYKSDFEIKKELCEIGRRIYNDGFVAANDGNFSVKIDDNTYYVTPTGKQKEYEERTKAKKKAEIEARKDAIRTEDIAKGVFIPVSSLPQREPQKGAKTT